MQDKINVFYKIIADNLKKLRLSKKLSQERFAEVVGCSREYISRLENYHERISLELMLTIALIYELDPRSFLSTEFTLT